jgi:hypothetical protein
MGMIARGSDHQFLERASILLVTSDQPSHQVAYDPDRRRRIDDLFRYPRTRGPK